MEGKTLSVFNHWELGPISPYMFTVDNKYFMKKEREGGRWEGRKEKGVRKTRQGPNAEECWHFKLGRVTLQKEKQELPWQSSG